MKSAIQVGDFLLLSSLIYKTNKNISTLSEEIKATFLPDYYEACAIFHFYENDMPQALKDIEAVLQLTNLTPDAQFRCIHYRIAMLAAANLHAQAQRELDKWRRSLPALQADPITHIYDIILAIDTNQSREQISVLIERTRVFLRKFKDPSAYLESIKQLENFNERKKAQLPPKCLFPPEWEPIFRVDLWLIAKQENRFYYNLLLEEWQKRKKVF